MKTFESEFEGSDGNAMSPNKKSDPLQVALFVHATFASGLFKGTVIGLLADQKDNCGRDGKNGRDR